MKIARSCILVFMLIFGITKIDGASAYCDYLYDPTSGGNSNITTADAVYMTWETDGNGIVTITMVKYGNNPYGLFRNFNIGSLTVNGAAGGNYFTQTFGDQTTVNGAARYGKVILTPKSGVTVPVNAQIVYNGFLEYATEATGVLSDLWPFVTFTYTYGTSCAGVPKLTATPNPISFTPTQGTKSITLSGLNLTGNLTLTATKGLSVSPASITPEADGTISAANQTVTATWTAGATTGGKITISGGGVVVAKTVNVTSTGFSEYCNTFISQENDGTTNLAYLTVTTSADKKQVILLIEPYDANMGATAKWKGLGTIKVNNVTQNPTITYNNNTTKTQATLTFANALTNGDIVSFGGPLVWELSGTLWNNTNCYINAAKTYTVGLGCSVAEVDTEAPVVVSAAKVSSTSYNAVINVNATDNKGVTNVRFVDAANSINVTQAAKSDNGSGNYTITNLQGNTAYSFIVKALDLAGNETSAGNAKTVSFTTLHAPQLSASPATLEFTPTNPVKTFTISGTYVTDPVQLSVPSGYTVTPSTFTPSDGTLAPTIVTVSWVNGLGKKIVVSGGGLEKPAGLVDLTYSGGFSDYCSYVITQGGGATLTTPALLNISLSSDKTTLTYKIEPFDITGDATWNNNSLAASLILLNGVAANPTRTKVDNHTITLAFSRALADGDVISYGSGATFVWTTSNYTNYANNGNCFIDNWNKIYTVGQNCNISSFNVSSNSNISNFSYSNCDIIVNNGVLLNIDESKTYNDISVGPGAKLTLEAGKTLTANSILLQSDATGTATFVDNGTSNITAATVQQYLTSGRNWYISSPVSNANTNALSSAESVVYYDEPTATWKNPANSSVLNPLMGYISVNTMTNDAINFSGTLNTGNKSIELTRTPNVAKSGFNLVGNPYPSYLNWDLASAASTNLQPTVWFRTKTSGANSAYIFDTYNAKSAIGTNNNLNGAVTKYIPPMQAFWVRVTEGKESGTLILNNAMRSHNDLPANKLRVSSAANSEQQVLRLQVSNGKNADEAIVLFNENASNNLDDYDSQKMNNGNATIPEIYTLVNNQQLVINGFNTPVDDAEIPLGFNTGESNTFSIKATEISNFNSGMQILLKDRLSKSELDLTSGGDYNFSSDVTNTKDRFSLLFKAPSISTDVISTKNSSVKISRNENNQVVININGTVGADCSVAVYNTVGQKLLSEKISASRTVLNTTLVAGIYLVSIQQQNKNTTTKLTVK